MLKSIALTLVGCLYVANAAAGNFFTFTVIPAQPVAGQPFNIQVTKPAEGCGNPLPSGIDAADLGASIIRYALPGYDFCEPNVPAQDMTYDVPALPAGNYTFRFALCGLFPVDCHTLEDRTVVVIESSTQRRFTIPALSLIGAGSMIAVVLLIGLLRRRSGAID